MPIKTEIFLFKNKRANLNVYRVTNVEPKAVTIYKPKQFLPKINIVIAFNQGITGPTTSAYECDVS